MGTRTIHIVDLTLQARRLEQLIISFSRELVNATDDDDIAQCREIIKNYFARLDRKKEVLRRNVVKLTAAEIKTIRKYKDVDILRSDVARLGVEPRW